MHILQAAKRRAEAQTRMEAAAGELAKKLKLPPDVSVNFSTIQERDPIVKQIRFAEAVADLLESVLVALKSAETPPEALPVKESGVKKNGK